MCIISIGLPVLVLVLVALALWETRDSSEKLLVIEPVGAPESLSQKWPEQHKSIALQPEELCDNYQ